MKSLEYDLVDVFNGISQGIKEPAQEGRNWTSPCLAFWNDVPTCLLSYFLPCVTYGMIRTTTNAQRSASKNMLGYLLCSCTVCSQQFLGANQRYEIRKLGKIRGNYCNDLFLHTCCSSLAMTQEMIELRNISGKSSERKS